MKFEATVGLNAMLIVGSLLLAVTPGSWAATLQVGADKQYKTVRAAALAARDGDTVEIDSGNYSRDVATWRANNLTVRGVGTGRPHLSADGVNEGSKGIWVVQGANFTVQNIEFSGASVPDHNGAGIRAEGTGKLTVLNCYFHDNEDGILGPSNASADLVIENSIFERNGFGDGYSHNMYVGRIHSFRLQCSYSHLARAGHNVKSRASENYILYNRIMDEDSGTASYEVDLPEGGRSFLIGNIIQKGPNAENSSIIAYAAENTNNGVLALYAVNNTIVNSRTQEGTFLQLRPGTTARIINNILMGSGTPWPKDGITLTADHNYVDPSANNSARLVDPSHFNYHLQPDSPCKDAGVSPGTAAGYDLTPKSEYDPDAHCRTRPAVGAIDIGAFEYQTTYAGRTFFPQCVIGGGYSTLFSATNVGASTASGELILTDESGGRLPAVLTDNTSSASPEMLSIPPGATRFVIAGPQNSTDPARRGWARIESSGGTLWGAATFRLEEDGTLRTTVGVLGSQLAESVVIPVDNDDSQSRYVGFALANPNGSDINVSLSTFDERGQPMDTFAPADLNPLGSQMQVARFLHQYLPSRSKFRGSMVLWETTGQTFATVALVLNQGQYTAIPVIAGKPRVSATTGQTN